MRKAIQQGLFKLDLGNYPCGERWARHWADYMGVTVEEYLRIYEAERVDDGSPDPWDSQPTKQTPRVQRCHTKVAKPPITETVGDWIECSLLSTRHSYQYRMIEYSTGYRKLEVNFYYPPANKWCLVKDYITRDEFRRFVGLEVYTTERMQAYSWKPN